MPFGVKRFPNSNDPRTLEYCWKGYAGGALPPYKFSISSFNATFPFDVLNGGVVLPVTAWTDDYYEAFNTLSAPLSPSFALNIWGYLDLQGTPPSWTIHIGFACTASTVQVQFGDIFALRPYPIQQWVMSPITPVAGPMMIPNPLIITPVIWNTPNTP